jgi:hypothetical protein
MIGIIRLFSEISDKEKYINNKKATKIEMSNTRRLFDAVLINNWKNPLLIVFNP